jgi:dynein assembly factor 1
MIVKNPKTEEVEKWMTKEYIHKLLRSDFQLYYCTPELNDSLYMHYKGFVAIENLE